MIKIEYGKEHSDCTSDYIVTTNAPTVGDFINEWLTNHPGEWGCFSIKTGKGLFNGDPYCEYRYGKIISNPLSNCILSKKIKHVTGIGGYSNSNFQFEIEMDKISEDILNKAKKSDWITEGLSKEEVDECIQDALEDISNQKLAQIKILKKVRTEIIEKHCDNCTTSKLNVCYKDDLDAYCETYDTLKIIDRNIYKLKGELK